MLASAVASPSRWWRAASAMAQAAIKRKGDDAHRRLECADAPEFEPVQHHRRHIVQPGHEGDRSQRDDGMAHPADGGEHQHRQRQRRVGGDMRLDQEAAKAGARNFRHVAEQGGDAGGGVEAFEQGGDDQDDAQAEMAWGGRGGAVSAGGRVIGSVISAASFAVSLCADCEHW